MVLNRHLSCHHHQRDICSPTTENIVCSPIIEYKIKEVISSSIIVEVDCSPTALKVVK